MERQEWLNWRKQGIGGSDAPVIMGVSPWKTPYQLWQEKALDICTDIDNSSMKRGRALEEIARVEFSKLIGKTFFPDNLVHPERSWLRASLDGINDDHTMIVEIKCPNKNDHFVALNKKVPEKYYPQCQHQLAVTNLPSMYYYSFDGREGAVVEVARDQAYITDMLEKEQAFWDLVVAKTPPQFIEGDTVDKEFDPEWGELVFKWKETIKSLKILEEEVENLRCNLISLFPRKKFQRFWSFCFKVYIERIN